MNEEQLSIGDVAEATGIASETIRIWERRYGRPRPVRLPSGHRRYSPAEVRWLRRVAEALALGHRPSKIIPLEDRELSRILREASRTDEPGIDINRLMKSVIELDERRFLRLLEAYERRLGLRELAVRVVGPFLTLLGRAWADGDLAIHHEHFASDLLDKFLRRRTDVKVRPNKAPGLVMATLEGERHGLGLRLAQTICGLLDVTVTYLGFDVPNDEIVEAVLEADARAAAISVSLHTAGVATDRLLADLRQKLPDDVQLVVGGRGARGPRRGPRGVEYMIEMGQFESWLRGFLTKAEEGRRRQSASRHPRRHARP